MSHAAMYAQCAPQRHVQKTKSGKRPPTVLLLLWAWNERLLDGGVAGSAAFSSFVSLHRLQLRNTTTTRTKAPMHSPPARPAELPVGLSVVSSVLVLVLGGWVSMSCTLELFLPRTVDAAAIKRKERERERERERRAGGIAINTHIQT